MEMLPLKNIFEPWLDKYTLSTKAFTASIIFKSSSVYHKNIAFHIPYNQAFEFFLKLFLFYKCLTLRN